MTSFEHGLSVRALSALFRLWGENMEDENLTYEVTFYETRLPFDLREDLTRKVTIGRPYSTFEEIRKILAVVMYGKQEPELIHVRSLRELTQ